MSSAMKVVNMKSLSVHLYNLLGNSEPAGWVSKPKGAAWPLFGPPCPTSYASNNGHLHSVHHESLNHGVVVLPCFAHPNPACVCDPLTNYPTTGPCILHRKLLSQRPLFGWLRRVSRIRHRRPVRSAVEDLRQKRRILGTDGSTDRLNESPCRHVDVASSMLVG